MSQIQNGETLGSFRIESVLGSGAMGVVYRATNEKNGRVAAVKVLSSEFAPQGGKSKLRDRFEREAEILQQFRHPGIVRFLAVGRYRGTSYLAMEYVEGKTLEQVIQERDALPWREVVELGIQICDALHYAHERGIVHRDLKPSNLMVTADGKVKLTDFGIAKDLDATALTATGRTLGTAAYMAPEQIRGAPAISHKTDLYALGIVLYQLLTGKMPFEGNTPIVLMHCHLNEPPPRPSARVAEIPKALDELIVNLMAKIPADRPWDAAAAGMALTKLRDKAERGAAIAMVWPSSQSAPGKPSRSGGATGGPGATGSPAKKSRKARSIAALAPSAVFGWTASGTHAPAADGTRSLRISRSTVEIGLLVSALLAIGGFIGYWVYPPSAGYLYHQAELLMASNRRHDWLTAREDYLDPLDSRFPNNPYREQTQKWRDQILLDVVEGRAAVLSSPAKVGKLNQPANITESLYVVTFASASAASERGDDLTARRHWKEMAQKLQPDDPEQRPWYLLALERVKDRDVVMRDRRRLVETLFDEERTARLGGRTFEANTIRNNLLEQFSHFTDLADLFPREPQATGATEPTRAAPDGKTPRASERHQADSPQDAGASDRRSPPSSPDDEPHPNPPKSETKAEDGSTPGQTPAPESSNILPPDSVVND